MKQSRFEDHARAAVAAFGADVTLQTVQLGVLGCTSQPPLATSNVETSAISLSNAGCGCRDHWQACQAAPSELEPWLYPGAASGLEGRRVIRGAAGYLNASYSFINIWTTPPDDAPGVGETLVSSNLTARVRLRQASSPGMFVDAINLGSVFGANDLDAEWVEVTVEPSAPDGPDVACSFDLGGGWTQGVPGDDPNSAWFRIYEGVSTSTLATCWQVGPGTTQ